MDGYVVIKTKLDTKSFEMQIKEVEDELKNIDYELSHRKELKLDSRTIQEYKVKAEKLTNQLSQLNKKQRELERADLSSMTKNLDSIGTKMSGIIKKVGKWALAVFGIRTAYNAVRSAINVISEYNEQVNTDIQYITYALASVLEPVVIRLISFVYKLLGAINSIAKSLFNVDLFANASAEGFASMSKSAQDTKKSLAGFDEINMVQDTSASGTSGGTPSVDLSEGTEETIPILEKIGKIIKTIIELVETLGTKLSIDLVLGIGMIITLLTGNWLGLVVLFILAIINHLDDIKAYLGLVWEFTKKVVEWLVNMAVKKIMGVVSIIIGFISSIIEKVKFAFEMLKVAIEVAKAIFLVVVNWVYNQIIKPVANFFVGLWNGITSGANKLWTTIKSVFGAAASWVNAKIISPIKSFVNSLWSGIKGVINKIIGGVNTLIRGLNKVKIDIPSWVPSIGGKTFGFNVKEIPKLKTGAILNQPGRGVYVGNAIAGESGQEGILPLTDSQAMQQLGQEIGKHVKIENLIDVYMDSRKLKRILESSENMQSILRNGG